MSTLNLSEWSAGALVARGPYRRTLHPRYLNRINRPGPAFAALRAERPRMRLLAHRHVLLAHRLSHRQVLPGVQRLRHRALPGRRGARIEGALRRAERPRRLPG